MKVQVIKSKDLDMLNASGEFKVLSQLVKRSIHDDETFIFNMDELFSTYLRQYEFYYHEEYDKAIDYVIRHNDDRHSHIAWSSKVIEL